MSKKPRVQLRAKRGGLTAQTYRAHSYVRWRPNGRAPGARAAAAFVSTCQPMERQRRSAMCMALVLLHTWRCCSVRLSRLASPGTARALKHGCGQLTVEQHVQIVWSMLHALCKSYYVAFPVMVQWLDRPALTSHKPVDPPYAFVVNCTTRHPTAHALSRSRVDARVFASRQPQVRARAALRRACLCSERHQDLGPPPLRPHSKIIPPCIGWQTTLPLLAPR